MPHGDGKIYRETVGGKVYGISTRDVAAVIGEASDDIETLCTSGKINPDALFKPCEYNGKKIPAFATGGPGGMYGYTVPFTRGSLIDIHSQRWSFSAPSTWFRLFDFDGYDHKPRFENLPWGLTLWETASTIYCSFTWNYQGEQLYLCPGNMDTFKQCYMGVAIYCGPMATKTWEFRYGVTHTETIGSSLGALIQIPKSAVDFSTDTQPSRAILIPFICKYEIPATTHEDALSIDKWTINYKDDQFVYLNGTAPTVPPFTLVLDTATHASTNLVRIAGRVTNNNQDEAKTFVFYPRYIMYAYPANPDPVIDYRVYDCWDSPRTDKALSLSIGPGATVQWEMFLEGLSPSGTLIDLSSVNFMRLNLHSPSSASSSITEEVPVS